MIQTNKKISFIFLFFFTIFCIYSQNPKLIIQNGHSGSFIGDISPDGKHLVTGGVDGKILLWDLKSGRHFAPINNSMFSISDLKWDEDNQHIYSSDNIGNFCRWDIKTRSVEKQIFNADSSIVKIIPIPKKDLIFTLGLDSSLRIYDRKLNRKVYKRMKDTYGVCASYLSLNGNEAIIVGCRDSTQKIFSIPNLEELNSTALGDLLLDVCFNSDFSRVAYTFSSTVNLLTFPSGNPIKTYKIPSNFYSPTGGFSFLSTL
ncbi:MAG: WD40 repeat domain-containing protein, partial [Bacteroidota bacterium]